MKKRVSAEDVFSGEAQTCILTKDGLYSIHEYKDEAELENLAKDNWQVVFGSGSYYLPIKKKVESKAKTRITDGLLLDVANRKFWIVEMELSRHDLSKEVEPQIRGFLRALNNEDTISKIRDTIYEEIRNDKSKFKKIRSQLKPDEDLHYFVNQILHEACGIIIIIDEKNPELEEIVEDFQSLHDVRVIEFRTYTKGKERVHSFTPLSYVSAKIEIPEFKRSWNARLEWTRPETRKLVEKVIEEVTKFPDVIHKPVYRWYLFFKSKEKPSTLFLALMIGKKKVQMRICVDPSSFTDPKGLTKDYKGWFFKRGGREKGFSVSSPDELDYAFELVKQSYERMKQT